MNHQFLFNDWKRFFFSQTYFIRFPTYQSQVLRWLCNKYCCYVTAHGMQHVGSRDSNVQSPALFFAVKSSIIMESYHNVTIYSAGKCTLPLKILKTAFSSQRFAVHREKRMNLFLFTRRWINSNHNNIAAVILERAHNLRSDVSAVSYRSVYELDCCVRFVLAKKKDTRSQIHPVWGVLQFVEISSELVWTRDKRVPVTNKVAF